jgi:hypothetical protein
VKVADASLKNLLTLKLKALVAQAIFNFDAVNLTHFNHASLFPTLFFYDDCLLLQGVLFIVSQSTGN